MRRLQAAKRQAKNKMAEIVNLRRVRKAKARDEKEKAADANRILHGAPKQLRDLAKAKSAKAARNLDAHKKD
jgi:hypothetical protein